VLRIKEGSGHHIAVHNSTNTHNNHIQQNPLNQKALNLPSAITNNNNKKTCPPMSRQIFATRVRLLLLQVHPGGSQTSQRQQTLADATTLSTCAALKAHTS
jgi:hypothetical protein